MKHNLTRIAQKIKEIDTQNNCSGGEYQITDMIRAEIVAKHSLSLKGVYKLLDNM